MKVLFTFELPALSVRAIDYINMLLHFGHEVSLYNVGTEADQWSNFMRRTISHPNFTVLTEVPKFNDYRTWYYDLSTFERWQYPTLFWKELFEHRGDGLLVCVNYEDGYRFFSDRITEALHSKTAVFMNNALYLDREKYPERIRNKLFMTTSYISNSQKFAKVRVPIEERQKRVYFSGSVTGNATPMTNYAEWEPRLRIILAEMVHKQKDIPSIIRFFSYEPFWKKYYDEIPAELKSEAIGTDQFVDELSHSLISLCVKGNSYPTNRFFESMAAGCVTFSTQIDFEIEVYGVGQKGKDYVEIRVDGSDLIEKIKYYIDNPEKAKRLSENGRKYWEEHNMLDENGLFPLATQQYHIEGIKKICGWDIRTL